MENLKAKTNTIRHLEKEETFLYIPLEGNAPMLLLEVCMEMKAEFTPRKCIDKRYVQIVFNKENGVAKKALTYINNNL